MCHLKNHDMSLKCYGKSSEDPSWHCTVQLILNGNALIECVFNLSEFQRDWWFIPNKKPIWILWIQKNTSSCLRYEIEMSSIPADLQNTDPQKADTRHSGGFTGNEQQTPSALLITGSYATAWRLWDEQRTFLTVWTIRGMFDKWIKFRQALPFQSEDGWTGKLTNRCFTSHHPPSGVCSLPQWHTQVHMHISWLETKWTDSQIRGKKRKKEREGEGPRKKSATLSHPHENLLKTLLFSIWSRKQPHFFETWKIHRVVDRDFSFFMPFTVNLLHGRSGEVFNFFEHI